MKKTKLFKSLLLAAGMLVGSASAWAGDKTVVKYSFDDANSPALTAASEVYFDYTGTSVQTNTKFLNIWSTKNGATGDNNIPLSPNNEDISEQTWTLDYYWAAVGGGNGKTGYVNLKAGTTTLFNIADPANGTNMTLNYGQSSTANITVAGMDKSKRFSANTKDVYNKAQYWYHITIVGDPANGVKMTMKSCAETPVTVVEDAVLSTTNVTPTSLIVKLGSITSHGIDELSLTYFVEGETCDAPTYTITGANGTSRRFTLACGTSEATIYYATSELEKGAEGWTTYTSEVTTEAATIYAYAAKGTTTSDVISFETGAGEAIALNAPTVFTQGLAANGEYYNAILNASYNAAGVEFTPAATITATFTPKGGTATDITLPYTATERGELTVTATADGFTSTSTTINVYAAYEQGWQSVDFSSLIGTEAVQAALGENWTLQDGHGRWASWKDAEYNFYQHGNASASTITVNDRISMREVVLLAEGMGLGRNVTGGEAISVKNTTAGEIVAFEIYNGFGSDINKGTNTYMSYVLSNGTDNPSMSSTNGALLVQATVYTPVKTTYTASYFKDNDWDNVYAYVWSGDGDSKVEALGTWPGTKIEVSEDGSYSVSFDALDIAAYIIFNNGDTENMSQSGDLAFVDGASYNTVSILSDQYTATFTTNTGWENVYVYAWSGESGSEVKPLGNWPGIKLAEAGGKYTATIMASETPDYIIFHNNEGSQTSDLDFENGKAYTWNNYTVTFTTGWTNVNAWAWNVVEGGTENLCGTWPGTAMSGSEGTFTYTYTGVSAPDMILFNNGTDQTSDFTFEDGKNYTAAGPVSVDKTITAAGYATYCSPYALDFSSTGLKAYIAKRDGAEVTFTEVTKVPANTGVLLKGDAKTYTINTTTETIDDVTNNALVGVTVDTKVDAVIYVLMDGSEGVGFYQTTNAFTVGANTAYIPALTTGGSRNFIALNFGDNTTTAIEGVATVTMKSDAVFNLQGQRVNAAKKGLYIVNGKKMILK